MCLQPPWPAPGAAGWVSGSLMSVHSQGLTAATDVSTVDPARVQDGCCGEPGWGIVSRARGGLHESRHKVKVAPARGWQKYFFCRKCPGCDWLSRAVIGGHGQRVTHL